MGQLGSPPAVDHNCSWAEAETSSRGPLQQDISETLSTEQESTLFLRLCQPDVTSLIEWETLSRSALPSGEASHTFYILHSMWLCTIADTLMMVSHVWRSEDGMKSKVSHRSTSVIAAVVTNHRIVHLTNTCFDLLFLWTFWSAYVNAKILSGLTSLYRMNYATTLRAIMWHT